MSLGRRALLRWGAAGAAVSAGVGTAATGPALAVAVPPAVRRSVLLRYTPDGSIRWQTPVPLGRDERGADVIAAGGRLFTLQGGALRAFDLASGRPDWVRPLSAVAVVSPLAVDGLVVLVLSTAEGRDVRVAAFDQITGRHRWTHDDGADFIILYPVRPGLVIAQQRHRTVALDTATGQTRWAAPIPDDHTGSFPLPATSASTIVVGGGTTTAALDAGTGRRLWARPLLFGSVQPVLAGSVVALSPLTFGGSGPGGVLGLDARTGVHRWTVPSRNASAAVVAADYGVVVAVTGDTVAGGVTTAVTATTGRVLWSVPEPAAALENAPSAITAHGLAYLEDLAPGSPGHQRHTTSLVNRRLRDGRLLYRRPMVEPIAQGQPPQLHSRYLPLMLAPTGHGPVAVRLFDLATHRVRFTARTPHWPTAAPLALPDGSLISLTADLQVGYAT